MKSLVVVTVSSLVLIALGVAADQPYTRHPGFLPGCQRFEPAGGANQPVSLRALTFYSDRASFNTAFPGLPIEDFSGTSVPAGTLVECDPPYNSATNNGCFAPGAIMAGIEFDVNNAGGDGSGVVLGIGYLGNAHVWVGPNAFADDVVLNFYPAVRAAGFELVNPGGALQSHSVEIFGPSGWLGSTPVLDSNAEGNFWGVDTNSGGGISSIVFNNGGNTDYRELVLRVTFGGTPVSPEHLTFHSDRSAFNSAFPDLQTEDFSGTSVGPGAVVGCDVPFNSATDNDCFSPGAIMEGIEIDVNMASPPGEGFVSGVGYMGSTQVWIGAMSFADDVVLNFDPAVRAAGFDLINPISSPQTHTVEVFGPSGWLGITTVVDSDAEGNFWGVDADDDGGITSIVFNNAASTDFVEVVLLVTFGGMPGSPIFSDGFESSDVSRWSTSTP